ncbi:hypothetical protein K432DRAFT_395105 [Lepidopterella palustris CBS 459.81]|uniref:Uncharacterized protein n=1 Tax=Lepidopterella palustris CBS 459.81 TaxID=1314670 RepID=A0A8E2JD24_9PEZI|nr:hypothetical protein K432DRAFT_395105 [Lepidopterella palustris CBS 459.81]
MATTNSMLCFHKLLHSLSASGPPGSEAGGIAFLNNALPNQNVPSTGILVPSESSSSTSCQVRYKDRPTSKKAVIPLLQVFLDTITKFLPNKRDLQAIRLVSRETHDTTLSFLFDRIYLIFILPVSMSFIISWTTGCSSRPRMFNVEMIGSSAVPSWLTGSDISPFPISLFRRQWTKAATAGFKLWKPVADGSRAATESDEDYKALLEVIY